MSKMESQISEILKSHAQYNLTGMTKAILKHYQIDDTTNNYKRVETRLKEILQRHHLWYDERYFYKQEQLDTFIREIKPFIDHTQWEKRLNDAQINAINNLGNDLNRYTYTMSQLLDYIISKFDFSDVHKAKTVLRQRLQTIINTYRKTSERWAHTNKTMTISRTYELLVALKPYLLDHHNLTIVEPFAYSQRNFINNLMTKYHISLKHQKDFNKDLSAYNFINFSKNQTKRMQNGRRNAPSYFTTSEVKALDNWAKEHAAKYQAESKPKTINKKTKNTKGQHHDSRYDEQGNRYYSLAEITDLFLKVKGLPDTDRTRNNMAHAFISRLKKAYELGAIKAKKRSGTFYSYPAEIMNYFKNNPQVILERGYNTIAKTMVSEKTTESTKTTEPVKTTSEPVNNKTITNKEKPAAKNPSTKVTDSVALNNLSLTNLADPEVQLKIMLKRFLTDHYEIKLTDWEADKEAIKHLDANSAAYQTIVKRLQNPGENYLKRK